MVKKIFILFFVLFLAFGLIFVRNLTEPQSDITFGIYANGENLDVVFDRVLEYGFATEISGVTPEIFYSYNSNGEVIGEFFKTIPEKFDINDFSQRLGLTIEKTQFVDNNYIIFAKSALLPYKLKGQNFNVEISINQTQVVVGSPIIFGSY